jgi:ABC-type Mn2+/Zn2+ transport system permease subunit
MSATFAERWQSFLHSWSLFDDTYYAAWLIAVLLALVGVFVVARDQIFVGAAIAQASTLGVAIALCLGAAFASEASFWRTELSHSLVGGVCAVGAALVAARVGGVGRESHEAVTGFIWLLGASASVLIIAHSPHGLDEVQQLVSSSVVGATRTDVVLFAALTVVTALLVFARRRPLTLLAMDPAMARTVGVSPAWDTLCAAWLGVVMGTTIHTAGVIYAFGCLVLPALVAKNVCRETLSMFVVAPIVAFAIAVAGFVGGNLYDFNEAQLTVALLCVALAAAWTLRSVRRR